MDQNCTTDQYGHTGCIGTAVSTHGGLPVTGFDVISVAIIGLLIIICGVAMRLRAHG